MERFAGYVGLGIASLVAWAGAACPAPTGPGTTDPTTVTITLFNDSCGTYIAPKFGVCPLGLSGALHHFVEPPAVVAPGQSITYTTDQVAGITDGDCAAFSTDFTVGISGWGYGPTNDAATMTYVGMPDDPPYVGTIGVQFHCGDTIELRWSNCDAGGGAGTWTSEVIPAAGNPTPTEPFGPPAG